MKHVRRIEIGGEVLKRLLKVSEVGGIPQYTLLKDLKKEINEKISKSELSKILRPLEEKGLIEKKIRVLLRDYIEGYEKGHRGDIVHLPEANIEVYGRIIEEYPEQLINPLLASYYLQANFTHDSILEYLKRLEEEHEGFNADNFVSFFKAPGSEGIYQLEYYLKQSPTTFKAFLQSNFSSGENFKNQILGSMIYDFFFSSDKMRVKEIKINYSGKFFRFLNDEVVPFVGGFEYKPGVLKG